MARPPRSRAIAFVAAVCLVIGMAGGWSVAFATDQGSAAATFSSDTLDPPTDLTCSSLSSCSVAFLVKPTLTWTATVDTYATGYQIWRSTTSGSGYALVGSVSGRSTTTFTDWTVAPLTTYYYVVRSVASSWTSSNSNEVQATVLA